MSERDFSPIADSLRREVARSYSERGEDLSDAAGLNTLETNSGFVERRGRPLLEMLGAHSGLDSIAGLDVLDLGCGFGALAALFAAEGATVIGIDPKPERLEVGRAVAAEHELPARFAVGRMQRLDFPDATFDVVFQVNVLCYVVPRDQRRMALRETLRVLRPGGSLVVRNPNRWNPIDQFTRIPLIALLPPRGAVRAAAMLGRERSNVRLTSPLEAVRELRAAGFDPVAHASAPDGWWHAPGRPFARYQHLVARRPR